MPYTYWTPLYGPEHACMCAKDILKVPIHMNCLRGVLTVHILRHKARGQPDHRLPSETVRCQINLFSGERIINKRMLIALIPFADQVKQKDMDYHGVPS